MFPIVRRRSSLAYVFPLWYSVEPHHGISRETVSHIDENTCLGTSGRGKLEGPGALGSLPGRRFSADPSGRIGPSRYISGRCSGVLRFTLLKEIPGELDEHGPGRPATGRGESLPRSCAMVGLASAVGLCYTFR